MITDDVTKLLLELEAKHGAGVVRRACERYSRRRTYVGEVTGKRKRISWQKKKDLYAKQSGLCASCSDWHKIEELEVDEFIPISRGGQTVKSNIRLLCRDCNRSKSNNNPSQEAKRTGELVIDQVKKQMTITLDEAELGERRLAEIEAAQEKIIPLVGEVKA